MGRKNHMKYESFHYDMDGVIVDSEPVHVMAEKDTCQHFGLDVDLDSWDDMKGKTAVDIFGELRTQHMTKHATLDVPSVEELVRYKTNNFVSLIEDGAVVPVDGALELLAWTRDHSAKQGLVTSSNRKVTGAIVRQFNLDRYFDTAVTGNDVRIGKPHPGPYLKSLRLLGANARTALAFEDSKNGLRSAVGAKMGSMAITSSYHDRSDFAKINPTYIVDSWSEALMIIARSQCLRQE